MFGPILKLHLYGTFLPCLQKSEDASACQAVKAINTTCSRVRWIRNSSNNSSAGGFLGGLFSKAGNAIKNNNSTSSDCVARIVLQDSGGDGQPEIFIDPLPEQMVQEGEGPPVKKKQSTGYKLNLKLRRVDKVSLDETSGEVILFAKPVKDGNKKSPPKELLRFTALLGDTDTPITQDERNNLVHHFMVISEWERQRRAHLSDEDAYESDDDEDEPNFLAKKAQQARNRATREIEMKQTRKSREERKAKLIAQTGGLKYTAMAMANRS